VEYDIESFYRGLVEHGLIVPVRVQGAFGRGAVFEDVLERFNRLVTEIAAGDGAEVYTFPPVIDRTIIEKTDYLDSFPNLAGTVFSFFGKEKDAKALSAKVHAHEPWGDTQGMTAIRLKGNDEVVGMEVVEHLEQQLLVVTEQGFGKRTEIEEYRVQSRGGVGIINIGTSERNGLVVGVAYVQEGDELLLITQQGMILRMQTNDVRAIGRATQGVRLIDIEGEDRVVSIAKLVEKEDAEPEG